MPGMNGVELATAARQAQPGLKVLFITGFAEERVLPTQSGEQVLRKPFRVAELAAPAWRPAGSAAKLERRDGRGFVMVAMLSAQEGNDDRLTWLSGLLLAVTGAAADGRR